MIKLARPSKQKRSGLPSSKQLLLDSVKLFRTHWKPLVGLTIIIAVPSVLLRAADPTEEATAAYLGLGALFMNLALLWAVTEAAAGRQPRVKDSYYRGNAPIVSFILVILVLTLQFAPFMLGYTLFVTGTMGTAVTVSAAETALLMAVWLILSLPTIYWMTRYLLSIFAVADGQTPVQALRTSSRLVRGRSWPVLARQAVLLTVILLILTVPSLLLSFYGSWRGLELILPLFATIVILPIAYIYLHKLYKSLQ